MKYLNLALLAILALLSLAAGVAKVMQAPQELSFFQEARVPAQLLLPFGITQILGGLLSSVRKFRSGSLLVMAVMFGLSSIMIFMTSSVIFGLASLIPCGLALALHFGLFEKTNSPE